MTKFKAFPFGLIYIIIIIFSNCVNLLTNYPSCCMDHLTDPLDRNLIIDADKKEIVYEGGAFMNAPNAILEYLMNTLNKVRYLLNANFVRIHLDKI